MKKRIFMFVNYTPSDKSLGITKKIGAEIRALRNLGYEVSYSAYTEDGAAIFDNKNQMVFERKFRIKNKTYQTYRRYFMLINCCQRYIEQTDLNFEICYGRLSAPNHSYIKLLRRMKEKSMEVILESHAYFPGIKFQSLKGRYITYMLRRNGGKLQSCVDKFLTEGRLDDFYGVRTQETRVGVETKQIKPHIYRGSSEELNVISVANETLYHGYDRMIKSIAEYKKRKGPIKITLHLVGEVNSTTRQLAVRAGIKDEVIFYGKKYGDELDDIYETCNLGMGPLGQHRIGGKKDTGLKTKEYFAKGLPYFYAGKELEVLKGYPYIYEVPSDESIIHIENLWEFYGSYKNDDKTVENMRAFAEREFSWTEIMRQALEDH